MFGFQASLHLLLLLIGIASTCGQRLPVPRRQLLAPSLRFAESFESFDSDAADEDDADADTMQRTQEQLRQLLGRQLSSAVAPLTAVPFAGLIRRQPGIVSPSSGVEAAQRFASDDEESSEELSSSTETETDADAETDVDVEQQPITAPPPPPSTTPQPQPQPETEYNPYRDNFQDRNEDGSYVFG